MYARRGLSARPPLCAAPASSAAAALVAPLRARALRGTRLRQRRPRRARGRLRVACSAGARSCRYMHSCMLTHSWRYAFAHAVMRTSANAARAAAPACTASAARDRRPLAHAAAARTAPGVLRPRGVSHASLAATALVVRRSPLRARALQHSIVRPCRQRRVRGLLHPARRAHPAMCAAGLPGNRRRAPVVWGSHQRP